MLINMNPTLWGWIVTGTMLISGCALGMLADRLLRLLGVVDKGRGN